LIGLKMDALIDALTFATVLFIASLVLGGVFFFVLFIFGFEDD